MRDQFFGDVYDYLKYGLIRRLTNYGETPSALCWMMRPDEDNDEGRRTNYLEDPAARDFEPEVYDLLLAMRDRDERDVRVIERSGLLPNTRFWSPILTDDRDQRRGYFDQFLLKARTRELVCFDPDTGIQGGQGWLKPGAPESSKYLMKDEVDIAFGQKHSLLIFVYKMLVENEEGIMSRTQQNLVRVRGAESLLAFLYRDVGFFLVPQPEKIREYSEIAEQVQIDWPKLKLVKIDLVPQRI